MSDKSIIIRVLNEKGEIIHPEKLGITLTGYLPGRPNTAGEFVFNAPDSYPLGILNLAADGYEPFSSEVSLNKNHTIALKKKNVIVDEEIFRGNYLATPGFPFAHMYPGWDKAKQDEFRRIYVDNGNTHLPFAPFGSYGDVTYDYRNNPNKFNDLCAELKNSGILPVIFVLTNNISGPEFTLQTSLEYLDQFVPFAESLVQLTSQFVCGWEASDIYFEGDEQFIFAKKLRQVLGIGPQLYYHDRPNWWGPHYPNRTEWNWWSDTTGILDGILFQVPPNDSIAAIRETLFEIPWGSKPTGVVGRVVDHLGKKFVMFEHSRDLQHYNEVVDLVRDDSRISGWS